MCLYRHADNMVTEVTKEMSCVENNLFFERNNHRWVGVVDQFHDERHNSCTWSFHTWIRRMCWALWSEHFQRIVPIETHSDAWRVLSAHLVARTSLSISSQPCTSGKSFLVVILMMTGIIDIRDIPDTCTNIVLCEIPGFISGCVGVSTPWTSTQEMMYMLRVYAQG